MKYSDDNDPKGLIYESFRIENITQSECRTIFLDWALSLPMDKDTKTAIAGQLEKYRDQFETHPMLEVLRAGLLDMSQPRRRGGWRSKNRPS